MAELSLAVRAGEVFGFLGPNGAGKTTSLKMLLGLVRPSAGTGRLLGAPLGDRAARARVGFLPEHFRFHEWLTGRELLAFHGRLFGMRGPRLKGMLQRVGLAQAMLNEPEIVFLDEPTSGLDPLGRLLVRDVIADLKAQGTAVFLNSHLLGEVEVTCDRVAFVKQGRVVRELSLADEATGLEVELRVGRLGADARAGLVRFGHELPARNGSLRLRVEREDVLPELARWLVAAGADLYELKACRTSLETVFLEVMGEDRRPG